MKKTFLILGAAALIAVPFAVSAEFLVVPNIVGCGINTVPKFIKAVLSLLVKIGIPVASIFLIWTGFLFLTAQGNESQLKKAKSGFMWTCIGFGVLIGAWLFAMAFEGVITSFSGGQAQTTSIDPCGTGAGTSEASSENPPIAAIPTIPSVLNAYVAANSVASAGVSGNIFSSCVPIPQQPMDVMSENGLVASDPQLFTKAKTIVHNDALTQTVERSYTYFDFEGGSGYLFLSALGGSGSVAVVSKETLEAFIDTSVPGTSKVTLFHTHPWADLDSKIPPSAVDLLGAYQNLSVAGVGGTRIVPVRYMVADSGGMWEYGVPVGSAFWQASLKISSKFNQLLSLGSSIPELLAVLGSCASVDSLTTALEKSLQGVYGNQAKTVATDLIAALQTIQPLADQDARIFSGSATPQEIASLLQEREAFEKSLGVNLVYTPM